MTYAVLFLTGSHSKLLALLTMLAGFSCVCALALFLKKRAFQAGWAELRLKRFGTADLDAIRQLAEDYAKLCEAPGRRPGQCQRQVRRSGHLI